MAGGDPLYLDLLIIFSAIYFERYSKTGGGDEVDKQRWQTG